MDKSTFAGIALAVLGIAAGLMLEGGKIAQIIQPTAAMIVFGGTLGAVMVQFPIRVVIDAAEGMKKIFLYKTPDVVALIQEIVAHGNKARRFGIVSLDDDLPDIKNPFLQKTLTLAVDGTDPLELRRMVELELENTAEREDHIPKVFEAAGGFAPTIGIIGAVLGLIQVMQHLDNINEVGKGIAVAFVATIYGVGSANIFFLPAAGKLKLRIREEQIIRDMTLEGVVSILEGMNPRMLEMKLLGFLREQRKADKAPGEQQ